jgi:hypothetical protein
MVIHDENLNWGHLSIFWVTVEQRTLTNFGC